MLIELENARVYLPGFRLLDRRSSTTSLVSMKQFSLKPAGELIALVMTAGKQFLPVGL